MRVKLIETILEVLVLRENTENRIVPDQAIDMAIKKVVQMNQDRHISYLGFKQKGDGVIIVRLGIK